MTVTLASPIPLQLDGGTSAAASDNGTALSASTVPATLRTGQAAPDLLASTSDANTTSPYIQAEAAELGYDPTQIFSFVRDQIRYQSYAGALRGALGTLWSGAGNSLDKASLLVALLRASGIPAQYEQGTLSTSQEQQLILSMFPRAVNPPGMPDAGDHAGRPRGRSAASE